MRVWLLHIGEELPVDGQSRLFRYGYLANALQDAGHEVLRWSPTFRHSAKVHRFPTDTRVSVTRKYAIQFVHSPGYRHNTSVKRLYMYRVLARRFRQLAIHETPPDIIVAAIPSLEWAEAAIDFGRTHSIPVVIDVRDRWPDVFLNSLPATARPLGRVFLSPYYRVARRVCMRATALTAVSQSYLNWALSLAGRNHRDRDLVVPLGFEPVSIPFGERTINVAKLRERGVDLSRPTCMFAGLFERSSDLETVVRAACQLESRGVNAQFVVCGDGSKAKALKRQAEGLSNIRFLGWVDAGMLQSVASISTIGLCAYAQDALQSLPNKPYEYMAARLAIVSSLTGEMSQLLEQHQCGFTYAPGDDESLARTVAKLVDHPALLASLRSNSYQTWLDNYRGRDIYSHFVDHLSSLTTAAARAA